MTIPVPVEPEPEFLEANPVLARTGFQCKTGIPAGTGIHQMKFRPNRNCIKVKKLMNNTKVKRVQLVYDVRY